MKRILEKLEEVLRQQAIYCAYSIARAQSFGMNAVLHGLGYQYRGRLINNCYIFEKLEDMNMWVKDFLKNKEILPKSWHRVDNKLAMILMVVMR